METTALSPPILECQDLSYETKRQGHLGASALVFADYRVPRSLPVSKLLKSLHLTGEQLLALNPDMTRATLRRNEVIPRGYVMKLPADETVMLTVPGGFADK